MLDVLGLKQTEKDAITESFAALKQNFNCTLDNEELGNFDNKTTNLGLLSEFQMKSIKNVFKIRNEDSKTYILSIYLTEIHFDLVSQVFMYGIAFLGIHLTNCVIQPMTILDKLSVFRKKKGEILKQNGSKNKYLLINTGKPSQKTVLPQPFLNELFKMNKIYIEIYDNMFVCSFQEAITTDDTLQLAAFISKIDRIFSKTGTGS